MVGKRKWLTNFDKVRIAEYYLKNQASGVTILETALKFEVKLFSSIHDWIQNIEELRVYQKNKTKSLNSLPAIRKGSFPLAYCSPTERHSSLVSKYQSKSIRNG